MTSDGGQPTGDAPETQAQTPPETPQVNPADVAWRQSIESAVAQSQQGIRSLLERVPEPQAPQAPDPGDALAALYDEAGGIPDPNQLMAFMQEQIQTGIQSGVNELRQEVGQITQTLSDQQINALETRFPELTEEVTLPNGMKAARGEILVDRAVQMAEQLGVPRISAQFLETVHLAEKARELAGQETPAGGGSEAHLETGGGAAPAQQQVGNRWEAIKASGVPSGPLF